MIKTKIITIVVLVAIVIVLGSAASFLKNKNALPINPSNNPPTNTKPATTVPSTGEVALIGTGTCLPHRDTTGPQTMECAMGFAAEDGNNYGLADVDSTYKNVMKIGSGGRYQIKGVFMPKMDPKYDSVGVVTVSWVNEITEM